MPAMLLALLMAALLSPAAAAKCREECGGVKIQYPFGIGRDCYLRTGDGGDDNEPFNVTCSNRDADGVLQPKPIAMVYGVQLLDIDVDGGRIWVYSRVSWQCDNTWWYDSTTFRISDTENVLTVVGCNVLAYIGTQDGGVENRYVAGCNASCPRGGVRRPLSSSSSMASNGHSGFSACDGTDGCFNTTIQRGIRSFFPSFVTDGEDDRLDGGGSGGSRCRYAFLVEKEKFKFRTSYVTNRELEGAAGKRLPLVLDWAVGNKSCLVAQKDNATYACRSDNHTCVKTSRTAQGIYASAKLGTEETLNYVENGCQCEFSLLPVLLLLLIVVCRRHRLHRCY